jgi:hypothetical protein
VLTALELVTVRKERGVYIGLDYSSYIDPIVRGSTILGLRNQNKSIYVKRRLIIGQ